MQASCYDRRVNFNYLQILLTTLRFTVIVFWIYLSTFVFDPVSALSKWTVGDSKGLFGAGCVVYLFSSQGYLHYFFY